MATKFIQSLVPSSKVVPTIPNITKMMRTHKEISTTHLFNNKNSRIGQYPNRHISTIKVAKQSSGVIGDDEEIKEAPDYKTIAKVKAQLYDALQLTRANREIFGVPTMQKSELEDLVKLLESQNPTPDPIQHLEKVGGCWKLLYSTIRILGSNRTKFGLRDFISLENFLQIIDVAEVLPGWKKSLHWG